MCETNAFEVILPVRFEVHHVISSGTDAASLPWDGSKKKKTKVPEVVLVVLLLLVRTWAVELILLIFCYFGTQM